MRSEQCGEAAGGLDSEGVKASRENQERREEHQRGRKGLVFTLSKRVCLKTGGRNRFWKEKRHCFVFLVV